MILRSLRNKPTQNRAAASPGTLEYSAFMPDVFYANERSILSIPSAKRAIELKSSIVATMPLHCYDGDQKLDLQPLIVERPDPLELRITTLSKVMTSLILRGNSFLLVGLTDESGFPNVLTAIPNSAVGYDEVSDQFSVNGIPKDRTQLLHICGPTVLAGSRLGLGVLDLAARTIDHATKISEFGRRWAADSAMPQAVFTWDEPNSSQEDLSAFKRKYMSEMSGRRTPIVLPPTIKFEAIQSSNRDAQFLETTELLKSEMALLIGVPGFFLQVPNASMTYSNSENQGLDLIRYFLPELRIIEDSISSLLPPGITVKFNPGSLLRADTKTRYETHAIALQAGFLDIDEVRALENREPLVRAEGAASMGARELAEALQKIYLSVGTVISPDEAREILNREGAGLPTPGPIQGVVA